MPQDNNEIHENIKIVYMRIIKTMKILNSTLENQKNHENHRIPYENHEHYENLRIPYANQSKH